LGDLQRTTELAAFLARLELTHKSNSDAGKARELFLRELLRFSLSANQSAEGLGIFHCVHYRPFRDEDSTEHTVDQQNVPIRINSTILFT
jgi:hypothetical protein